MKKGFWVDGLSIKESKFSILGAMLIVVFIYSLIYHSITSDLTSELVDIFNSLLLAFVGVNAVDRVSTAMEQEEVINQEEERKNEF